MTLTIPDDTLEATGLTERELRIEIACRLYDAGKLALWPAAQLAGLGRTEFEGELVHRGLAVYRYTPQDLQQDLQALNKLGRKSPCPSL